MAGSSSFPSTMCWRLPAVVVLLHSLAWGDEATSGKSTRDEAENRATSRPASPIVQLVLEPRIQQELKLEPRQLSQLNDSFSHIERQLWPLRDASTGPAAEARAKLTSQFEQGLEKFLSTQQQARLQQLVVQAQGWQSLSSPSMAAALNLSPDQRRKIETLISSAAEEMQQLANGPLSSAERDDAATKIRQREGKSIQAVLTFAQRKQLAGFVGERFDLSQIQPVAYTAPALGQVDRWINSRPLAPADVRGKVVAFHFWAFGCINCIRNLPHYNAWHRDLAKRGLIVWGMHTPETKAEHDLEALQNKVESFQISYPVTADHENQNWNAWANYLWPSVYLIDKRGKVRYWWYGELNWQGAEGEKFMRQKIEALLAEPE